MTHKNIYSMFTSLFPDLARSAMLWFPNGRDTIRIRQKDGREFIFIYTSEKDWRLETADCFLKRTLKLGQAR